MKNSHYLAKIVEFLWCQAIAPVISFETPIVANKPYMTNE